MRTVQGFETISGEVCTDTFHVYPKTYAGDPQYAEQFFNTCLCGKKRRITTITEVDNIPPTTQLSFPMGYAGDTLISNGLPYRWDGSGYRLQSKTSA